MKYLAAVLVAFVASCATPPAAPATRVEWAYKGESDYEARHPGGGTSKRYESNIGWIDVYWFSAGRDNWLEGTSDPGLKPILDGAAHEILQAQDQGHYRNVGFGQPQDVTIAGRRFRHFPVRYEFRGKAVNSHTFLTAMNGQLLKYRMSFNEPIPASLDRLIETFIGQTLHEYEKR